MANWEPAAEISEAAATVHVIKAGASSSIWRASFLEEGANSSPQTHLYEQIQQKRKDERGRKNLCAMRPHLAGDVPLVSAGWVILPTAADGPPASRKLQQPWEWGPQAGAGGISELEPMGLPVETEGGGGWIPAPGEGGR